MSDLDSVESPGGRYLSVGDVPGPARRQQVARNRVMSSEDKGGDSHDRVLASTSAKPSSCDMPNVFRMLQKLPKDTVNQFVDAAQKGIANNQQTGDECDGVPIEFLKSPARKRGVASAKGGSKSDGSVLVARKTRKTEVGMSVPPPFKAAKDGK